jgi:hypothetical protein
VKSSQVDPRFRHQGNELSDVAQRLENDVRGAVPVPHLRPCAETAERAVQALRTAGLAIDFVDDKLSQWRIDVTV